MFFRKEKFSMTDLNIDKMLNGEDAEYFGEISETTMSIVVAALKKVCSKGRELDVLRIVAKRAVKDHHKLMISIYESIVEQDVVEGYYSGAIESAWHQGRKLKEMEDT